MKARIVVLSGDGVGPEVVAETRLVLLEVAQEFGHEFVFDEQLIGGAAIDAQGDPLPPSTLDACRHSNAILLGAVGGPRWDDPRADVRPEQGLLALRAGLGLYANLRPIRVYPEMAFTSPIKAERLAGVDLLFVRELTGGLYFGKPRFRERIGTLTRAVDTLVYTDVEIRRLVKVAFQLARQRRRILASVDKANVLESSRLWREIVNEAVRDFPDVRVEHHLVDSAAMRLITDAGHFDVVVTENMFGDILSDEAAVLAGSLGLLPSASLGEGSLGLYEPIHGSAPDLAGKGIANPIGTILSGAMLLRHSLGLTAEAAAVEAAVEMAIRDGARTADMAAIAEPAVLSTREMGRAIRTKLSPSASGAGERRA